jgi:hypothetical protein
MDGSGADLQGLAVQASGTGNAEADFVTKYQFTPDPRTPLPARSCEWTTWATSGICASGRSRPRALAWPRSRSGGIDPIYPLPLLELLLAPPLPLLELGFGSRPG